MSGPGPWISGFYGAQNAYQPVSAIPWHKFTHIHHFAAGIDSGGNILPFYPAYLTQDEITALVASRPPGKKALVVITDQIPGSSFVPATAPSQVAAFVDSVVTFVDSNGYDGVDLDWESNVDVSKYVDLLGRLHSALPGKLITADMGNWDSLPAVAANRRAIGACARSKPLAFRTPRSASASPSTEGSGRPRQPLFKPEERSRR